MRKLILLLVGVSCLPMTNTSSFTLLIPEPSVMVASWYGPKFAGRPTASGEIFDPNKLTAAHKSLPLGTRAIVYYPKTGKSVEVVINDRGPYIPGRDLDLSQAAAESLGLKLKGVDTVFVQLVE